jgi:integrase
MARRSNIRRRGKSWVVHFRVDGKQVWRSFKTRDEAELYLANAQAKVAAGQFRVPATRVLFETAAEEWLRHAQHERDVSAATLAEYKSVVNQRLVPAFGTLRLEQITPTLVERWRGEQVTARKLTNRTANKFVTVLHGIFERALRAYGFPVNPIEDVEKLMERPAAALDFYSPEEVWALNRAAGDEQDAALFLTAAFVGLRRGVLVALRWRDVDFEGESLRVSGSYSAGTLGMPKWGRVRSVPMVPEVASALARLGQRGHSTGDDDLVFVGERGGFLDASAMRRRYLRARDRAGLRPLRFHDLRHVFGSLAIRRASIVQVQTWMGHADIDTTRRYLHHRPQADDAKLLAQAFEVGKPTQAASGLQAEAVLTDASGFRDDADGEDDSAANPALSRNAAE